MVPTFALPEIDGRLLYPLGRDKLWSLHMYIFGVKDVVYVCFFLKESRMSAESKTPLCILQRGKNHINRSFTFVLMMLSSPFIKQSAILFFWLRLAKKSLVPLHNDGRMQAALELSAKLSKTQGSFQCLLRIHGMNGIYLPTKINEMYHGLQGSPVSN